MKPSAITYLIITTIVLITVSVFASIGFPFAWVFYLTILGEAMLFWTVYKVLTDNYTTDKKFKDFYEDHPIGREERYFENKK